MQGEFNGLKTLILKENPCVYYVHCFAHQLQLALVAVAKNHNQISLLFTLVSIVVNVIGASCKRRDIVREKQAVKVDETLNIRDLSSGQDLNQETNLKRAGDTRWGSHYAMNIMKNRLRNRMSDEWMNDSLVVYIERDIFDGIDNDTIMERFQKMKTRRVNCKSLKLKTFLMNINFLCLILASKIIIMLLLLIGEERF
ncbi:hypothetical protein CsSME_00000668 [Camellia sinensis var. sinensis]